MTGESDQTVRAASDISRLNPTSSRKGPPKRRRPAGSKQRRKSKPQDDDEGLDVAAGEQEDAPEPTDRDEGTHEVDYLA